MPRLTASVAAAALRETAASPSVAARGAVTLVLAAIGLSAIGLHAQDASPEATMQALLAVALVVGAGGIAANVVHLPPSGGSARPLEAEAPRAAPHSLAEPRESIAGLRVLVAEGDPLNQLVVHALLNGLVGSLTIVCDGVEALEALRRQDFDLVLMDVAMPHLDGPAAVAAVRAGEAGRRETPIVALTAQAAPGEAERLRAAGFDDHLAKPFQPADLLAIVARAGQAPAAQRAAA